MIHAQIRAVSLIRLRWVGERVHADIADEAGAVRSLPVRLAWTKPVTGRGEEVSLIDERKKEVLLLPSLDALDVQSRAVAEEALERRYLIPTLTRIVHTKTHLGIRYWQVETDRGDRRFAMREPRRNITWLDDDRALLRDTLGNRYQIASYRGLDEKSRHEAERVL
jgi:hypothetical protein